MEVEEEHSISSPRSDSSSNPGPQQEQTRASTPSPALSLSLPPTQTEIPARSRSPRDRSTSKTPSTSRDKKRQGDTGISDRLISLLEEPAPKPHMPESVVDESYYFLLSLVPMLSRLNKDNRQQAKMEMLTTLHNLDKKQSCTAPPPPSGWQSFHPPPTQTVQPPPTFSVPARQPRHLQALPPQRRPMGPFMPMLSSEEPQWEEETPGPSVYTDM